MHNNNHVHNFAMFLILLSLLFIPIGFVGLGSVQEGSEVLSATHRIKHETRQLDSFGEEEEEEEVVVEETTETTKLTPEIVIPFYR